MTAAYRLRGIGWLTSCVVVALGFYLVSLQVAAERKHLSDVKGRIDTAERDIRALETEFDTRANLAQLERWNGNTLSLVAPAASQFVRDEAQLASIRFDVVPTETPIRSAALFVPTLPTYASPAAASAPAVASVVKAARVEVRVASGSKPATQIPAKPERVASAVPVKKPGGSATAKPVAVAMLDRGLLSERTFGDLLSGARAETGRLR